MSELRSKIKEFAENESGSLLLLTLSLFLLTLILSFAIIDISSTFLAKRELVNIGEAAISRAAHNIDLDRYYSDDRTVASTSPSGTIYLIPIDCAAATSTLGSEIYHATLRGSPISISSVSCTGDVISAQLSSVIAPTLSLPVISNSVMNSALTIHATISASNPIR